MAPASTTVCASSGECLQMSLRAEAEIRLRESSGSWIHRTKSGTAPASTTAWANSVTRMQKINMEHKFLNKNRIKCDGKSGRKCNI